MTPVILSGAKNQTKDMSFGIETLVGRTGGSAVKIDLLFKDMSFEMYIHIYISKLISLGINSGVGIERAAAAGGSLNSTSRNF